MQIIRESKIESPRVTFALHDWGCRESFHTIEYLSHQITDRNNYEIVWVEYYDRHPSEMDQIIESYEKKGLASPIDTWIIMERPKGEIFRKHWLNNIAFLHSKGDIVVFMDSDAISSVTLAHTIENEINNYDNRVLYLEEIRTGDSSFYPFRYPNTKEMIPVAANMANGVPLAMRVPWPGLLNEPSLIHQGGNYGACFAAKRDDLIQVGGWDEHDDYTGYIAGPYEMSMRMEWLGKHEYWSFLELLWHTPHPGNDGIGNYSGPHDGRGVSTTAMKIVESKRTLPLNENEEIRKLRIEKFGEEPPKALEDRANKVKLNHAHTPTSPVPGNYIYLPEDADSTWDKTAIFQICSYLMGYEQEITGATYSRSQTVATLAVAIAKELHVKQEKLEALYIAALFWVFDDVFGDGNKVPENIVMPNFGSSGSEQEPFGTVNSLRIHKVNFAEGMETYKEKRSKIPMEAYIVDLADRLDAMVNFRDKMAGRSFSDAYKQIDEAGSVRYAPKVVDAMKHSANDLVCIILKSKHGHLDFYYPAFRFTPEHEREKREEPVRCGEFDLVPTYLDNRVKYTAMPAWDTCQKVFGEFFGATPPHIFSSYDRNKVIMFANQQVITPARLGFRIIKYGGKFFVIDNNIGDFSLSNFYLGEFIGRVEMTKTFRTAQQKLYLKGAKNLVKKIVGDFVRKIFRLG